MKKLIALTSALAICAANLMTFSANAIVIYCIYTDISSRYAEDELLTKMFTPHIDFDAVLSRLDDSTGGCEHYVINYCEEGDIASPVYPYYDTYQWIAQEDADVLSMYLSESYPDITLNLEETSYVDGAGKYKLDYGKEVTVDEQREICEAIFDNTGLRCHYLYLLSSETNMLRIGDTDSDGTVNALDASNILTYYASAQTDSLSTYSDEDIDSMTLVGDYDGDGNVNAVDASLVLAEYAEEQTKGT